MKMLRSSSREVVEGARRGLRPGVLFPVFGALALVALSGFALGYFVIALIVLFALCPLVMGHAVQGGLHTEPRALVTTTIAGLCMLWVIAVPIVGMWVALQPYRMSWALLSLGLGLPCFCGCCGPFLTAGPHLVRRNRGPRDALGHALAGATVDGFGRGLSRGAAVGLSVAVVPFALEALRHLPETIFLLGFAVVGGMSIFVAAWIVGFACACADEDDRRLAGSAPRSAALHLFVAPSIALLFALAVSLFAEPHHPRPWRHEPPPDGSPPWIMVLGALFFLIGVIEVARNTLRGKADSDPAVHRVPGRVRLAGDTAFDKSATISAQGEVDGEARFVSDDGTYAFSLPSRVRLVGVDAPITTDAEMVLVARGPLESMSLRDGLVPLPQSAMLTTGGPDALQRESMDERARSAGLWGMAATVAFVVATGLLMGPMR